MDDQNKKNGFDDFFKPVSDEHGSENVESTNKAKRREERGRRDGESVLLLFFTDRSSRARRTRLRTKTNTAPAPLPTLGSTTLRTTRTTRSK